MYNYNVLNLFTAVILIYYREINAGVTIETVQPGDGKTFPKQGQTVIVHYTGTLTNGNKFDSSRDRGKPFEFKIGKGHVIKGWDEGVAQMSVGQRAILTCSPDYAYGDRGYPPVYPFSQHRFFVIKEQRVTLTMTENINYQAEFPKKTNI